MGLERRGNGLYFYRKRRIGNRVISEYCGAGTLANCFYILDQQRQEEEWTEKETKKRSFEAEKQIEDELDSEIESVFGCVKTIEDALFLINGYHVHSRQWRRKAK